MTLMLEVEYLSGVCFAARGPDSEAPDWPPQPDRIFSALVATWAARGQHPHEAQALEWLERLPPPRVLASEAAARTRHTVYVPPNDYEIPTRELNKLKWYRDYLSKGIRPPKYTKLGNPRKGWMKAVSVVPVWRERKERTFPGARPHDPVVRLLWPDAAPDGVTFDTLQRLAGDTAYVGHSASLARCRFLLEGGSDPGVAKAPSRWVYKGRLAELRRSYDAGRRPLPGARVRPAPEGRRERASLFGDRWLILEHIDGDMPDLRACALVAKTLRDTLLCGYKRIGLEGAIPEVVSGHAAGGKPSREPHLAVLALPFAGFPYADGHVMGLALVPPQDSTILDDEDFRNVLRKLAPLNEDLGRRVLTLTTKEGTPADRAFSIALGPTFGPPAGKRSLDPTLYTGRARTFATVTPLVLDRHLKEKGQERQEEMAAQIAIACRNIGLPGPEAVVVDKHSALEGVPSAYPSAKAPAWTGWRMPPCLASRQLTHAVIRFAAPVDGPVILGSGRFVGLGLCRPLEADGR